MEETWEGYHAGVDVAGRFGWKGWMPTLMRQVRTHLDDRQVVELVGTIAAYNMVSRFLEALQIHSDDARPIAPGP